MNRFVLIDGNAILHRAFHAFPPLNNQSGQQVNAVYGFFSMFLKILSDLKPHFITVCFDRPKPTFRKLLYVGYQATRPKMDEGLSPQIKMVHDVLQKAGIQLFEVDGYEADDLIGTIALKVVKSSKETEVIIVSGDRDLLQLVNSHVRMLAPVTGITNMILYDGQRVEEKFGIRPDQIIDYKALVGDASDNYPGVQGIGPKTASSLIKKYSTFENLYEHLTELPPKIAEKLATDAEQAALCKKLATIITDAPIQFDIKLCNMKQASMEELKNQFAEYGFNSLEKRLQNEEVSKLSELSNVSKARQSKKKTPEHIKQLGLL